MSTTNNKILNDTPVKSLSHLLSPNLAINTSDTSFVSDTQIDSKNVYVLAQIRGNATLFGNTANRKFIVGDNVTNFTVFTLENPKKMFTSVSELALVTKARISELAVNSNFVAVAHDNLTLNGGSNSGINTKLVVWSNDESETNKVWEVAISGMSNLKLLIDSENLYLAGAGDRKVIIGDQTFNSKYSLDYLVAKIKLCDGKIIWVKRGGDSNQSLRSTSSVTSINQDTKNGDIVVTGWFENTIFLDDLKTGMSVLKTPSGWAGVLNCAGEWVSSLIISLTKDGLRGDTILSGDHVIITDALSQNGYLELVGTYKGSIGCETREVSTPFYWHSKNSSKITTINSNISKVGFELNPTLVRHSNVTHIGVYFDTLANLNNTIFRNKGETGVLVMTTKLVPLHHQGYNVVGSNKIQLVSNGQELWLSDNINLHSSRHHGFMLRLD